MDDLVSKRNELAELIFGDIKETIADLEACYPARNLPEGAKVTRFAPSPTGFLHTGSLFTAMIANKIAKDTKGIFYLRLEDTDTKRTIEGSAQTLVNQLNKFNIIIDEGFLGDSEEGNYGPYKQSLRRDIYRTVIKEMIKNDLAYPCFASEEELAKLREEQTKNKIIPGYYGEYALYRNLDINSAIEWIKAGKPYVIRFKSQGNHLNKIKVHDEIRGDLELSQNDQDIVILKSDGLPTYHFAHVVDDHFMRTNLITRGEEWLSSLPIHLELFKALGFKAPKYAHLPVIMKLDNGNRRKLSKRKDNEASVDYFLAQGYEPSSVLTYLMTIANSNYEEYLIASKNYDLDSFKFSFKKMSLDGALFDTDKLNFYGKEILSRMNKEVIAKKAYEYAQAHDEKLKNFIEKDYYKFVEIMNIEREKNNPRKDYAKYSDIYNLIKFFDHDEYVNMIDNFNESLNPKISKETIKEFIGEYLKSNLINHETENDWFSNLKEVAGIFNFCPDTKLYKANPDEYLGNMNDAAEIIRLLVTTRKVSPSLFSIMKILGEKEVISRAEIFIDKVLK